MNRINSAAPFVRRRSTITRVAALLFAATVAGVTGCSSDQSTGPGKNTPVGSYALRQVDEDRIPAEIYHGPYFDAVNHHFYNQLIVEVTGGSVALNADDTFSITFAVNMTGDGQSMSVTVRVDGTYEMQGDQIYFEPDDETLGAGTGTLRNGTMTLDMDLMGKELPKQYSFRR